MRRNAFTNESQRIEGYKRQAFTVQNTVELTSMIHTLPQSRVWIFVRGVRCAIVAVIVVWERRGAIGADASLPDPVAVDCGTGHAADVGFEGEVQGDGIRFSEIRGRARFGVALGIAPESDNGLLCCSIALTIEEKEGED